MKTLLKSALSWLAAAVGLLAGGATAYSATFPASLAGSYQSQLIVHPNPSPVGSLEVTVGADGKTSGKVTLPNGKSYPFTTTLAEDSGDGLKVNVVVVKGPFPAGPQPLALTSLRVESDGTITCDVFSTITGASGLFVARNTLKFATFTSSAPANWEGTYTMAMLPAEVSSNTTPVGAGYGTLAVAPNGNLVAKMVFGDGTKKTISAKPTANAEYRLFSALYTSGGYFSTVVDLDDLTNQDDALWNKPANSKDSKYKDGFSATLDVTVREWIKLSGSTKIPAAFTSSKNFSVDFSGEGLSDTDFATTLPDTARFTGAGKIQAVAGGASAPAENNSKDWNKLWSVSVNPVTGEFTGTQVLKTTVGAKTTSKTIKVAGVILADDAVGDGEIFALGQYAVTPVDGTEITGLLSFTGPLEDNVTVASSGTYTFKFQRIGVNVDEAPLNGDINAARPRHAPKNGAAATLILSEDLTVATLNGLKLPHLGSVAAAPQALVYQSSGTKVINLQVHRDYTGAVTGVSITYYDFLNPVAFATQGYYQQDSSGINKK